MRGFRVRARRVAQAGEVLFHGGGFRVRARRGCPPPPPRGCASERKRRLAPPGLRQAQALFFLLAAAPFAAWGQPTGLSAAPGNATATLAWTDPSDSSITGYSVRHATSTSALASASWTVISGSTATTTTHTVSGLTNGTRYHFQLRAANSLGDGAAAQTTIQLAASPAATVTILDTGLRGALETALGKSSGETITQLDMARLQQPLVAGLQFFNRSRTSIFGISDLTGIGHAVNLRVLYLGGNSISDVSALGTLTSLTSLVLDQNSISDVSSLGTLTSLRTLYLRGNSISDVSALGNLTSLIVVVLAQNSISDVSVLGNLTSLIVLAVDGNSISDVSSLGTLTSLRTLYLGRNSISDVSSLGNLTSLVTLAVEGNSISDASSLGTLTSLYNLFLGGNSISDVSSLGNLTSLRTLYLDNNSISDVSALGTLTSLTVLNLDNNSIDVSSLGTLTSLRTLYLGGNSISDVSALGSLASLRTLRLNGNSISDVSALGSLASLTRLSLYENAISDVSSLRSLSNLELLDLSANSISDVRALRGSMVSELGASFSARTRDRGFSVHSEPFLSLTANPLGTESVGVHIPALQAQGVDVSFDPFVARTAPGAPAGLVAWAGGSGRAMLGWTRAYDLPGYVRGYQLRHGVDMARLGLWTVIDGSDGATTAHEVSGIAGGSHMFELRAVNGIGAGPAARASVTFPAAPDAVARIVDAALAAGLAAALGRSAGGTFTHAELATITTLDLSATAAPQAPAAWVFLNTASAVSVANLSGLELLVNLRRLNLDNTGQIDLAPVLALAHIEWLSLRGVRLTSDAFDHVSALRARGVEVLFDAPASAPLVDAVLREAVARALDRAVGTNPTEGDLLALRTLDAANAGIVDLSGIEYATRLETLSLAGNQLTDLSPLERMTSLEVLDLSRNGLSDVSDLVGLANLRALLLDGNALVDLAPLAELTGLRELSLAQNRIADASALSSLAALEVLSLARNRIVDLGPLAGMSSLRQLRLDGNRIEDAAPLRGLGELEQLYLNDNALESLVPLAGLRSLRWLEAARNRIAAAPGGGFGELLRLRLTDNRIADLAPLAALAGLDEGDVVGLRGNPLSAASIARHLPALRERGVAVLAGESLPVFPAADDPSGRQGFARVVNRSDEAGEVLVEAVDGAGKRFGPVRLAIGAGAAAHFNSRDLERGNAAKGLPDGIGAPSVGGGWRLELISTLDIEALAYIRPPDGFLTSVHDGLPRDELAGALRAAVFNPGSNEAQRSSLRLVNPGGVDEPVSVWGVDDDGWGRLAIVGIAVPAGGALTLDAATLERGRWEGGRGLGNGAGKWRLAIHARWPVEAAGLLTSPSGHMTNLSTTPAADVDGVWRMPLFPAADDAAGRQGFVRVTNLGGNIGEVRIVATDDGGHRADPVAVELRPFDTVHLNSEDLERGNAAKGLPAGVGAPTRGDWRLALTSVLDIQVTSFVRHADGFLTSMHDAAPWDAEDSAARVVFFNPASNRNQESLLRLINDGDAVADVTISAVDDAGASGGEVTTSVPAGEALTLTAVELESGSAATDGALGDGDGKWRLTVSSDNPITVTSLLRSPGGHLTNLSSAPQ